MVDPLLLETLEGLKRKELKRFKWWLEKGVLDSCKPIPSSRLEDTDQEDTVTMMTKSYGEEMAVKVTVEILKKMDNKPAAEKLTKRYAGGNTAAASTSAAAPPAAAPAAPPAAATMMAQQGGVNIAPSIAGSTIGTLNINFNKQ